jgi:3-hydroxypropanoate dehydrogenase
MTNLELSPADLAAYESDFDNLAIPAETADLLFRTAQTANSFTDTPVSEAQMQAVYDLIKWGPTAMNNQPLRVVLVRSPEARAKLGEFMSGNNKAKTVAAPLVAILAADLDFHEELPRVFPVFPGARDMFAADDAVRAESASLNTALQIGYFIVGVRAAGLAVGPMAGFDADAVSAAFFPDGRHRALLVVNLGHPADDAFRPRQPRLDYSDVVTTV